MKKCGIFYIVFSFIACLVINGQVNYKARGLSYVASGQYDDAQAQFEAERAVLKSKKVNQNSPEFIDVEKMISYAKQCQVFSQQASQALNLLTDEALQNAFEQCDDEEDADRTSESLLVTLEKARTALTNIRSKFSTDRVARAKLELCSDIQRKITRFRDDFPEVQAWKTAIAANTTLAYEEFLVAYPRGNFSSSAKNKISELKESVVWAEVCSRNDYDSYLEFISLYPNGVHIEEARQTVDQMGDELLWASCKKSDTTDSYKQYIAKYPSGNYIASAKELLAKCQERDFWEAQSAKNTISAYRSYLSKYPKGAYAKEAQNSINKINEASAWAKAVQENTVAGYQAYLNSSKTKSYRKDAEDRISQIQHAQEVDEDNARWAKIANSTSSFDFDTYLSSSYYKGHVDEATRMYSLLTAREFPLDSDNAQEVIDFYGKAMKFAPLNDGDTERLNIAKEIVSYQNFLRSKNALTARSYLESYPGGRHTMEISDFYSKIIADSWDIDVSESDLLVAMGYAKSRDARSYVQKIYNQNQSAYRKYQRSQKAEPFHALLALDGIFYNMNEQLALDIAPIFSLGNRSNRLNLELGYYIRSGYAMVRTRFNLAKNNYYGKPGTTRPRNQYSRFSLFVAPEFVYFVQPLTNEYSTAYNGLFLPEPSYSYDDWDNDFYRDYDSTPLEYYPRMDYGLRAGFGIRPFEFFVGYRRISKSIYMGLTLDF